MLTQVFGGNVVVIDIETVPIDTRELIQYHKYLTSFEKFLISFGKAIDKPSVESIDDFVEHHASVIKSASLDYLMGKICSIGIIVPKRKKKDEVIKKVFFNTNESVLLNEFWDFVREKQVLPQTITYNGIAFDLPFLFFRSMVHGIQIPWPDLSLRRYAAWPNWDGMQLVCWWNTYGKMRTLSHLVKSFGYDVDLFNMDSGADVHKHYCAGDYDFIKSHNMADCEKTLFLYRKMRGYYPSPPRSTNKYSKNDY